MNPSQYQDTYRIASARLAGWDYGNNTIYFITICTGKRVHAFGEISQNQVNLNLLGKAAWDCWYAIPEHFPFVKLGEFVVMPNHVHGIVVIDKPTQVNSIDVTGVAEAPEVETQNFASLPVPARHSMNQFGPQSQNLASIVRGFKIGVTKYARQHHLPFAWQARYHDRIIRDAAEHERIRQYIRENPQGWAADCFY